jgi:hypothetical protein
MQEDLAFAKSFATLSTNKGENLLFWVKEYLEDILYH